MAKVFRKKGVCIWIAIATIPFGPRRNAAAVQPEGPPAHVVALAFVGRSSNYLTFVAPLLKKNGFGATFYVDAPPPPPHGPLESPTSINHGLGWLDIVQLSRFGFEIGHATKVYYGTGGFRYKTEIVSGLERMEAEFGNHGLSKPTTFYYPGGVPNPVALQILADKGYTFAVQDAAGPFHPYFDPKIDHPLLLPSVTFLGHDGEEQVFYQTLDNQPPGELLVLVFEGVGDPNGGTEKGRFQTYVDSLADRKCKVCSIRDLAQWANPGQAMRAVRLWRRDAHEFAPAPASAPKRAKPPTRLALQLENTILPKVDFQEVPVTSALETLRQMAAASAHLQVGFAVAPGTDASKVVTLHLGRTSLMEALRFLSDFADLDFDVGDFAMTVKAKADGAHRLTPKTPATRDEIAAYRRIILPKIDFHGAPVGSAIEELRQMAQSVSGGSLPPAVVLEPGFDPNRNVTLHLENVPFDQALLYLSEAASADFHITRYAICAMPTRPPSGGKAPETAEQMNQLKGLILPRVAFNEASLGAALDALRQKVEVVSKNSVHACFVINPRVDAMKPITLELTQLPFAEVLRYLEEAAGVKFELDRYAISVEPADRSVAAAVARPTPYALVH